MMPAILSWNSRIGFGLKSTYNLFSNLSKIKSSAEYFKNIMGDVLSPFTVSPPPPPSSSSANSGMPLLYYGLAVVGTAAIVLVMYNLLIIRRCSRRHLQRQPPHQGPNDGLVEVMITASSSGRLESSNGNLLSSFKYKKEEGGAEEIEEEEEGSEEYECPVCLSTFEEGEEVRKLPRCDHSFHAVCIDMWLYSHLDCPICRTPVVHFSSSSHSLPPEQSSRESSISV